MKKRSYSNVAPFFVFVIAWLTSWLKFFDFVLQRINFSKEEKFILCKFRFYF